MNRNSLRRLKTTKKKWMNVRNMPRPTLIQLRLGIPKPFFFFFAQISENLAACLIKKIPFQDHELQLVTYKALVEPIASPLKKIKVDSASDSIIQEVFSTL